MSEPRDLIFLTDFLTQWATLQRIESLIEECLRNEL